MSGPDEKRDGNRHDRGARLAEALRENLRRRKSQARSRRDPSRGGQEPGPDASGTGAAGQGGADAAGQPDGKGEGGASGLSRD